MLKWLFEREVLYKSSLSLLLNPSLNKFKLNQVNLCLNIIKQNKFICKKYEYFMFDILVLIEDYLSGQKRVCRALRRKTLVCEVDVRGESMNR